MPTSVQDAVWLRRYRPSGTASARLVCLPHAGGSASYFLPVSLALSPGVDVVAVQYPGRQDRHQEPPVDDLAVLADQVAAILSRLPELPLTVFGHSLGASLGFEVVRRLEATGARPVRLFASGRHPPSVFREGHVHTLDDAGILAELRGLNGTDAALLNDDDLMRAALPALRADYRAIELYRSAPDARVDCGITVLTGDQDPKTTLDDARAWAGQTTDPSFEVQVFSGGHFFLADHIDTVNKMLQRHFQG